MKCDPVSSQLWLHNGELREADHGILSAAEIGGLNGTGLFETVPLYHGSPFALTDHWERLSSGAERFRLPCPSLKSLEAHIEILADHNGANENALSRARITLLTTSSSNAEVHEVIEVGPTPSHPKSARVISLPFTRNERSAISGIKSINYGENTIALREAKLSQANDALFANTQNHLCEGIWSNIFVRIAERWLTPPLSSGCLPGVTRKRILEFAQEIEEEEIPMDLIGEIESAFFSSSMREIQPIETINGRQLSSALDPDISDWSARYREHVSESLGLPPNSVTP